MRLRPGAPPHLTALPASAPHAGAAFGTAVALSPRWVAVGAPRAHAGAWNAGAVDVYERLPEAPGGDAHSVTVKHVARIQSPRPEASARFGAALAVSGEWLAVGEPGATGHAMQAGCVHLYRWRGDRWALQTSLRAPASAVGWHGASVALAGDVLLVGAPLAERLASIGGAHAFRGAVCEYRRTRDGTASPGHWRLRRTFTPAEDGHGFGCAVAIDARAGMAVIGSSADSTHASYGGAAWAVCLASGTVTRLPCPAPGDDEGLGAGVACAEGLAVIALGGNPERSPPPPGRVHLLRLPPAPPMWRSPYPHLPWLWPRWPP